MVIKKETIAVKRMCGTAGWCGRVNGKPALTLSYYGGATLWVYDGEWNDVIRENGLNRLHEIMGIGYEDSEQDILLKGID